MSTFNIELVESRRFAVTLDAETLEQAKELAQDGQAQDAQFLEVTGRNIERIREADPEQGGQ